MDSSSMASFSSGSLSKPIRSLAKHILRLRRKPNKDAVDASSLFTQSELHDEKTIDNRSKQQHPLLIPRESAEALLAQAFAGVSAVKAAYAQLQIAQSPYEPDAIQRSDSAIVAELKHLSYLKHSYLSQQRFSHESRVFAEIQEQRNAIKTFEITLGGMESTLRDKELELTSLRDRLLESEEHNSLLQSKLRPESSISALDNLHLSGLDPTHFLKALRHAMLSVRDFVQHLVGIINADPIAVESQLCNHMFSGFHRHHFGLTESGETFDRRRFFEEFAGVRGRSLKELLYGREAPLFQGFCRAKFESLPVVVVAANAWGALFLRFAEMARRVWLLHLLFFSFEPEAEASIFVVGRGCRYSEVYMESVGVEGEFSSNKAQPPPQEMSRRERTEVVAFTVVPGFRVRRTVIQCKVYLQGADRRS